MIQEQELIIKLLSVLFPDAAIYLFGSRARGDSKEGSDIDIAIDDNKQLSIYEKARAKRIIEALNTPYTIDIVDINSIPNEMKTIILKEGIQWKKKN